MFDACVTQSLTFHFCSSLPCICLSHPPSLRVVLSPYFFVLLLCCLSCSNNTFVYLLFFLRPVLFLYHFDQFHCCCQRCPAQLQHHLLAIWMINLLVPSTGTFGHYSVPWWHGSLLDDQFKPINPLTAAMMMPQTMLGGGTGSSGDSLKVSKDKVSSIFRNYIFPHLNHVFCIPHSSQNITESQILQNIHV